MPFAGHHEEFEIRLRQIEGAFFLEFTYEQGRTRPMVAIPPLMMTLRIVQQGEQARHYRGDAQVSCKLSPMEGDPRPMARTMNALPIEPKGLPNPTYEAGWQRRPN